MENWQEITEEALKQLFYERKLSDNCIAEMYGVTKEQVRYKRKKFGISIKNGFFNDMVSQDSAFFSKLNEDSKNRLLKKENIDGIAKALTHFAFRNGPVEDMHANGKLTQDDMKMLNKYMVNRLAGILMSIYEEKWLQLELLYSHFQLYGKDWDDAEPDLEDLELIWQEFLRQIKID